MMCQNDLDIPANQNEVIRVEKREVREKRQLTNILIRTVSDTRTYYSIGVFASPETDPASDCRIVTDISGDAQEAETLFVRIAEAEVFPYCLDEVLSDLL